MRRSYRQIDGVLVEITPGTPPPSRRTHIIVDDLKPYKSIVDGEMIDGRRAHREHMVKHDMQEVGSSIPRFLKDKYEREHTIPVWNRDGTRNTNY